MASGRKPVRVGTVAPARGTVKSTLERDSSYRPHADISGIEDYSGAWGDNKKAIDYELLRIIGKGMAYPFEFDTSSKGVFGLKESWGKNKINQSIYLILSTRTGERYFNPYFGSDLPLLVFENYDDRLKSELIAETAGAISRWEPRIEVTKVELLDDEQSWENGQIGIAIYYKLRNSNISGNYVYPYQISGEPVQ